MPLLLHCLHDFQLMLGRDARKHAHVVHHRLQFVKRQSIEFSARQHAATSGGPSISWAIRNPQLTRNLGGSQRMVPRDHHGTHPRRPGQADGIAHLRSGRVDHRKQTDECEIALQIRRQNVGDGVYHAIGDAEDAHSLAGESFIRRLNFLPPSVVHALGLSLYPNMAGKSHQAVHTPFCKGDVSMAGRVQPGQGSDDRPIFWWPLF